MSLLDRLKSQPRWKSPDPAVRLAAIAEIEDAAELQAVAREDLDSGVRRAAVRRLGDVGLLATVAREDADKGVRDEAWTSLLEVATKGEPADSEEAVAVLVDPRHLAQVARTAPHAATRQAALARLTDARALGSVARQASDPQTALQAFERLTDEQDLIDVATNSEHKDVALAALENLAVRTPEARETFRTMSARAKHKTIARRAAALVQALDEADAAREAADTARREAQAAVCARAETLSATSNWQVAEAALAKLEEEWRSFGEEPSDDLRQRYAAATEAARHVIADRRQQALEAERAAGAAAGARAERISLCERAEALPAIPGHEVEEALGAVKAAWAALPPSRELPAAELEVLAARFDRACAAVDERRLREEAARAVHERLAAISGDADSLAASADLAGVAERWGALRAEWQQLTSTTGVVSDDVRARFEQAGARIAARETEVRKQQEQAKRDNLSRLTQLAVHLEARVGAEDLKLKEAERGLRNLRTALEQLPPLPTRRDEEQLSARLVALQAALLPRARELREMDDWKRFANAAAQEQLIAQMEALATETDLERAARALRDLHVRWREVAEAPRDQAEALWHRFKTASDRIRATCGEYFAQRADERSVNLKAKEALCEKAEALAGSTDWIRTAETFKLLQAEWKATGPVSRKHAKVVWKRFRGACDTFFTRRHDDLVQRKQMWSANLERKLALCAQAEALADSTEWERAAAEIRRLQAEWKTVGPIRKNKSEIVWQRFRTACDRFFERYKHRHQLDLSARLSEREALVVEIESLVPAEGAEPAEDLAERLVSAWSRWNQLPAMPRELIEPVVARLTAAVGRVIEAHPNRFQGTVLDPDANRRKMESLCQRVEKRLASESELPPPAADLTSTTMLAERLREALAANTIGGRPSSRVNEDTKWRAAADEVKEAQMAWRRLGPVPGESGRTLNERFNRACQRFFDQQRRRRPAPQGPSAPTRRT